MDNLIGGPLAPETEQMLRRVLTLPLHQHPVLKVAYVGQIKVENLRENSYQRNYISLTERMAWHFSKGGGGNIDSIVSFVEGVH